VSGRTAILVANGFDRAGRWGPFAASEALRYPWLDLCLREVVRRSDGTDYELFVWDNTQMPELRQIVIRSGARLHPTDSELAASGASADELVLNHADSLQRLWSMVGDEYEYVMTLDTDAFPVRDHWLEDLKQSLEAASVAGIWRDEMAATLAPFVHPSCLFMRTERLARMHEPFALHGVQDVGQRITLELTAAGERVAPLNRSNARNAHFLIAGLYGDLVYHHGAGSRFPLFRMTEGADRDLMVHERLREVAFTDLDHLIAVLRGESDDDLGLDWKAPAPVLSDTRPRRRVGPANSLPTAAPAWLDGLPAEMSAHVEILRRVLAAAAGDPRIRAVQVQGSVGRGDCDRYSDLDVGVVVSDSSWPGIAEEVPALLRGAGELVDEYYAFLPSADTPELLKAWAQFPNGIQMDLMLLPDTRSLGSGPDGRTLLDRDGRLLSTDHPMRLADPDELVKWAFLAWQNLTEVAKYLERDRVVAAAEWLNSARQATISCWAAAHGVEYSGFANVASARFGAGLPQPEILDKTYPKLEWGSVLAAAAALSELQVQADSALSLRLGIAPRPLGAWVRQKLSALRAARPTRGSRPGRRSGREI